MVIPDDVKRLARAGEKKIYAIHALRRATGMGLAEAKEIFEIITIGGYVELADRALELGEVRERRIKEKLEAIENASSPVAFDKRAISRKLLEILQIDEEFLDIARATYGGYSGLLVSTKRRLLFIATEMCFASELDPGSVDSVAKQESEIETSRVEIKGEFPLSSIYLVHHRAGLSESAIKIWILGCNSAVFAGMDKSLARSFAETLRFHIDCRTSELGKCSDSDHLEQLEALYDNGIITGEELTEAKNEILGRIHWRRLHGKVV